MWYILYEMLSKHPRVRDTWRGFSTLGALSMDLRWDRHTWWWITVFCSQEFVAALYKHFFLYCFFFCVCLFYAYMYVHQFPVDFWHLCLPQFYDVAIKLHSNRLSFIDRGILWTIEPELFDTHIQAHGYRLQVVNFCKFHYFFFLNC